MSVARNQRFFNSAHPCPICGGWEKIERGQGRRCAGYESDDGLYVHCTREDHAGGLPLIATSSTYAHFMRGKCKCGVQHGPGAAKPRQEPPKVVKFERGRTKAEMWGDLGPILAEYDYLDEAGTLQYQVVRFGNPKTFRQCRPDGAGKWIGNLGNVKPLPYRLSELNAADISQTIYIPEGEKDVESLRNRGLVATTNSGGALKWQAEFSKYFAGRKVVIIPDNDPDGKGQRHAEQVAKSLKPVAASVKVLALPAEIKDTSDWLAAGHSAEELSRLAQTAPEWSGSGEETAEKKEEQDPFLSYAVHSAKLMHADELGKLPPAEWLFEGEIQKQSITVIYGPSESGKSFVAVDYAERLAQSAPVVYIAAEGAEGYEKRLSSWCGYNDQPRGNLYFYIDAFNAMSATETGAFVELIRPIAPQLVIIDTLAWCMAAFGGDENTVKDMMTFMGNVNAIRRALKCTVIVIHHTGKTSAAERGSSSLKGGSDTMIEVTADEDLIKVDCIKQKNAAHFEPKYFKRLDWGESCVLVPAKPGDTISAAGKPSGKLLDILELLNEPVFSESGAKFVQLKGALELNSQGKERALYRSLGTLKKKGYVIQGAKFDPYHITKDGQHALKTWRPLAN